MVFYICVDLMTRRQDEQREMRQKENHYLSLIV